MQKLADELFSGPQYDNSVLQTYLLGLRDMNKRLSAVDAW